MYYYFVNIVNNTILSFLLPILSSGVCVCMCVGDLKTPVPEEDEEETNPQEED